MKPYTVETRTASAYNPKRCWINIGVAKLESAAGEGSDYEFLCRIEGQEYCYRVPARKLKETLEENNVPIIYAKTPRYSFYIEYQSGILYSKLAESKHGSILERATTVSASHSPIYTLSAMRTNTLLFLLGLCGACIHPVGAEIISSRTSASRASVMTTEAAIQMLQKYDIIDQFASGKIVSTSTSEFGKKYKENPISAISQDLLYHFMMYQDGVEEISDYAYIDTIIELYKRANTEQKELQAQGMAKVSDQMNALGQAIAGAMSGETRNETKVKTIKRLPVRCLEAFAAEGCSIKDWSTCLDNIIAVKPLDEKIMAFVYTTLSTGAPNVRNLKTKGGWTPLMYATCYSATAEVCKALIDAGADVNAKANGGWTPLMIAAQNSTAEVCKALIDAGADVNASKDDGWTPLMQAARSSTAEVCKVLIDAGAEVNAKNNAGCTLLMIAAANPSGETLKLFIAGADVNAKDNAGATPLMHAAKNPTAEVCKALIDAGADVNATANNGSTPLMLAAKNSTAEVCKALINAGADVNATADFDGVIFTPLVYAALAGNDDIVDLLSQNGADTHVDASVYAEVRRLVSNPIAKKPFPKGKHRYREVLLQLKKK